MGNMIFASNGRQRMAISSALVGICVVWLLGAAIRSDSSNLSQRGAQTVEAADGLYLPVGSLEEAVRRAGLIAVVVPTGESQQEWFASETLTATAYELRVERTFEGADVELGTTIWAYAPGGYVAESFAPQGSRRPKEGEDRLLEEPGDAPHFEKDRRELVFLQFDTDSGKWVSFPGGRFDLSSGVVRLFPEQGGPGAESELAQSDWRRSLVARSLADLDPILARAK
jgi:hypothetical protein